jgi:hypothetical protein
MTCPATDCAHALSSTAWPPFCHRHWFRLPEAMRLELRRLAPRNEYRPPSEQYLGALSEAVAWLDRAADDLAAEAQRVAAVTRRIVGGRE